MRLATAVFVLIAIAAVYSFLTPRLGVWQAFPPTLAALVLLVTGAIVWERGQPDAIKIGPDAVSAWNRRRAAPVLQGRVAGCTQWSNRLLILALAHERGRVSPLFIAADALPAEVFRELAVLGRRGSPASL